MNTWRALTVITAFASSVQAGCIAVEGAQITAGDLAKADSQFAKLDPGLVFSFAPAIGGRRMIPGAEIERWGGDHGLANDSHSPVCFERTSHELAPEDVTQAVRAAFAASVEDLHIDVTDVCRCKLPAGQLEFALSGASLPPDGHPETPVLWKGRVLAVDGHTYPVWARVRVLAPVIIFRAARNLRPQEMLSRGDIEEIRISGSPLRFPKGQTLAFYEGKVANISVERGMTLQPDLVHTPRDVERGSLVKVEVVNGGARLVLGAKAETAGNRGEVITLSNPAGAARFRANVTGPGRAEIAVSPERSEEARTVQEPASGNAVSGRSF